MSLVAERIRNEHVEQMAVALPAGRLRSHLLNSPDTFVAGNYVVNAELLADPWYFDAPVYEVKYLLPLEDAAPAEELLAFLKAAAEAHGAALISVTPRAAS